MLLTVNSETSIDNQGTVIVLEGTDDQGRTHYFAADHRPARDLLEIVAVEGDVPVEVESWQLLGGPRDS